MELGILYVLKEEVFLKHGHAKCNYEINVFNLSLRTICVLFLLFIIVMLSLSPICSTL